MNALLERHIQTASNLVEDFLLELPISRRRLLSTHLSHLPAARHRHEGTLFELNRFERLRCICFAIRWRIRIQNAREVSGRFGGGKDRQREATKLSEQRQRGSDVGDAAGLSWSVAAEEVDHRIGWNPVVIEIVLNQLQVARMLLENVVFGGVSKPIEHNPIDHVFKIEGQIRCCYLFGFDKPHVQIDWRVQSFVAREDRERLSIACARQPHGAELFGQTNGLCPAGKLTFNQSVGISIRRQHLQSRPCANDVVGQREADALGVTVVGDFVASPIP